MELLDYDPDTGKFTWKIDRKGAPHVRRGSPAGHSDETYQGGPRIKIKIDGKSYYAHRLAWFFIYKEWPGQKLDHRDCDGANNRLSNLRKATNVENGRNARKWANKLTLKGVSKRKGSDKWRARIRVDGVLKNLGDFDSEADAGAAYAGAAHEFFGEFARA